MFRDDAGKTEKPTPGKLTEQANKGNVPMSKELTTAVALLVAVVAFMRLGGWLFGGFMAQMRYGLTVDLSEHIFSTASLNDALEEVYAVFGMVALPFVTLLAIVVVATALAGYLQIGFKIRPKTLGLKLERLNPVSNFGKLFSLSSVMRTAISALKLAVLGVVLWLVLETRMHEFALLYESPSFAAALDLIADTAFLILLWIALIVLLIAVGDLAWQRFDYIKKQMMSKQEIDDEAKRNDGDPKVKARIRKAALELMKQRMMDAVPKADVVITNPTHFAVALKYDRESHSAPEVIAKGVDDVAFRIREIAAEHDVPLLEDPPLARALFRAVKIGQQVPERFYQAVATVLSQIYRMRSGVA